MSVATEQQTSMGDGRSRGITLDQEGNITSDLNDEYRDRDGKKGARPAPLEVRYFNDTTWFWG
jgi:hypothetical protein